jgi:hypothetical protein
VAPRPRSDPSRARRVLLVAGIIIGVGQLAAGLALDAAPPAVPFAQGDKVLDRASALHGVPFVSDHYHLNARGGAHFARMLASEVLAPRWLEASPIRRVGPSP